MSTKHSDTCRGDADNFNADDCDCGATIRHLQRRVAELQALLRRVHIRIKNGSSDPTHGKDSLWSEVEAAEAGGDDE